MRKMYFDGIFNKKKKKKLASVVGGLVMVASALRDAGFARVAKFIEAEARDVRSEIGGLEGEVEGLEDDSKKKGEKGEGKSGAKAILFPNLTDNDRKPTIDKVLGSFSKEIAEIKEKEGSVPDWGPYIDTCMDEELYNFVEEKYPELVEGEKGLLYGTGKVPLYGRSEVNFIKEFAKNGNGHAIVVGVSKDALVNGYGFAEENVDVHNETWANIVDLENVKQCFLGGLHEIWEGEEMREDEEKEKETGEGKEE